MNDWNVRNVSGVTGVSGKTGKTGMSGMSGKTGMSVITGCLWKVLRLNAWNVLVTHGCISRRSPCLLCVEFLFWNLD